MTGPTQRGWKRGDSPDDLVSREWLVTNGLGGYASGTIGGACTRRFHGKLVAALPAPLGRTMMFNHLDERLVLPDGRIRRLSGDDHGEVSHPDTDFLDEFAVEAGIPVWRYEADGVCLEKRVLMPYSQNTTYIIYRFVACPEGCTLQLRPSLNFRPHEGLLHESPDQWSVNADGQNIEIRENETYPPLRIALVGRTARLVEHPRTLDHILYRLEKSRGYEHAGPLWSPGVIELELVAGEKAGVIASVEPWDVIHALSVDEVIEADNARRNRMLAKAGGAADDPFSAQLVLAADQFLICPHTRSADEARSAAAGDSPRTVIAGYHWFTDWGRDTMISLEGLTLVPHRHREAGSILRTFASYIRDGLIPNMFPEGEHGGLYHTADATMWFFHAVARYVRWTGDRATLRDMLPKMVEIVDHHVRGTHFNIRVDPRDGLLSQGAEGYQLTWMDAKVDGWVVTPRRGKAVEINALYYNALRILQGFLEEEGDAAGARRIEELALRARESFNARFWYDEGQYLYDVVDPEDSALRPNQIFAIALDHPVLDRSRWEAVLQTVQRELLTPVGLRSLARDHPDYKPRYDGDLRARDAAYHQGTVWGWLIGPFVDAWLKVHPDDRAGARAFLEGFAPHLGDACIGTISEVFDAEEPYTPRGCAAQAWSVAEVLRVWERVRE
ncbi:MAG TPA: amylo-alpha-1,6-glucosidase [Thermoanaerobaculia bacterium]|nr:amylo-alpha-1,6-glucosidase [Thermoanaerobaculia bacterium]